ncbi:MAG TPA: T9SS type A sorting domain-containing protein [Saprospiraceae bacterium]|mgnify:CR=1 FL=1|nr:T9SS type A sorting domain-containing protein [Saprospiraceae bacterium]
MKSIGSAMVFFFLTAVLTAQLINDGAILVVQSGAILKLTGNLNNINGGEVELAGTLDIEGDLINEADFTTQSSSLVLFSGDNHSSFLSGGNTVHNLEIDKSGTSVLELDDALTIIQNINFNSGNLILGNHNLNIGAMATTTNSSSSSYAVTSGSGSIRRTVSASGAFNLLFPVGTSMDYLPFTFSANQQNATVMVYSGKVEDFGLGTDVDAELEFVLDDHLYILGMEGSSGISNEQVSMNFAAVSLSFDAQWLRIGRYASSQWNNMGGQLNGNNVASTENFTLPSTFALAKGIEDGEIPEHLLFQNVVIPGTYDTCFAANQTITLAGDGTTYTVESGAVVTFVAGLNIFVFPNTTFEAGSSVHLYIDDTDTWCTPAQSLAYKEAGTLDIPAIPIMDQRSRDQNLFFTAYPNPTSGIITLELNPDEMATNAIIDIVNMRGERISTRELTGGHQWNLNLTHLPPGIYIIRVVRQKEMGFLRIVKQ